MITPVSPTIQPVFCEMKCEQRSQVNVDEFCDDQFKPAFVVLNIPPKCDEIQPVFWSTKKVLVKLLPVNEGI